MLLLTRPDLGSGLVSWSNTSGGSHDVSVDFVTAGMTRIIGDFLYVAHVDDLSKEYM